MAQGPADNPAWWEQTRADLRVICAKVAALGFNAISLAEIAHLADFERLEPYLRTRVAMFQREMVKCLAIGDGHGLKVFVTMAVMILIPELKQRIKTGGVDFLTALLDSFLADFPQATGVIARIGEEGGRCFNGAALVGVRRESSQGIRRIKPSSRTGRAVETWESAKKGTA